MTWNDFKEEILSCYGSSEFEDHFEELSKFRQTGSVAEYYKSFIRLMTKAGNVTTEPQVSFFVGGLRDSLCVDVKAPKPKTLKAAPSYAKLYESRVSARRTLLDLQKLSHGIPQKAVQPQENSLWKKW